LKRIGGTFFIKKVPPKKYFLCVLRVLCVEKYFFGVLMKDPLLAILKKGIVTQREICPDLPDTAYGLPRVTQSVCNGCGACSQVCPTQAITVMQDSAGGIISLDRGLCVGCQACIKVCPANVIVTDYSTRTATKTREELVLTNRSCVKEKEIKTSSIFMRSLAIREVSTGCNATDQEVNVSANPVFDLGRFGAHFVASPRFADALIVTGPVGKAMREPLVRCYKAMAEPKLVIAVGTSAISGGLHRGGYAEANGVEGILPVAAYVPGAPPHPWSIIHGVLTAMGRK